MARPKPVGFVVKQLKPFQGVRENSVSKIKKFKELSNPDGSDEIKNQVLSAGDTEKLFRAAQANPQIIPFLALWFFAGIRRTT